MKKLFFLLLPMLAAAWLAGLGGCRKCKIEGRVLEFGTEKPIPNATAILSECEGEVLGSFNCFETARTVVGADGAFAFKEAGISLSAEATDYWPSGDDFKLVFGDCPGPTTVYLYPKATLEVILKNESGAYGFSSGNKIRTLLKGEQTSFTIIDRGNTIFPFIFNVLLSETEPAPTPAPVKFLINGVEQVVQFSPNANWVYFIPAGHETSKVNITF